MSSVNALEIRKKLGREMWSAPESFGPDGWVFEHRYVTGQVIVSAAEFDDVEFIHASIAFKDILPTYEELVGMHHAIFPGYSYQVFAPAADHINIHTNALHLWGRADGAPILPEFGKVFGSI